MADTGAGGDQGPGVRGDDRPRDRQTESAAVVVTGGPRRVATVKAVEDGLELVGGDAVPVVGHDQQHAGGGAADAEGDVPAGEPAGDECSLATNEEVAAAVGAEVAGATASDKGCNYMGTDGLSLLGYVYVDEGGKAAFESQRESGELIEGIGDGAIYFEGGGVYVLKGDALINMTAFENATLVGEAALRTALETVARLAVDRL